MKRLLILEDDSLNATLLKDLFTLEGFEVVTAKNTKLAEDLLFLKKIDLLITDINLPGINGLDWLRSRKEAGSSIPFIVTSGSHRKEDFIAANHLGAFGYLEKPINPEGMVNLIHQFFSKAGQK